MDYQALVGKRFGSGPEILIDRGRLESFAAAVGWQFDRRVPLLLVVSLLPALAAGIESPFPTPRLTVNYGLNRAVQHDAVVVDEIIRALFTFLEVESVGTSLQVTRLAEVTGSGQRPIASVETVARLVY
jgi:hypothetical protein